MEIPVFIQHISKQISKNSPTILTIMGAVGVVGTAVLAVRATPKALRLIEEEKIRMRYELSMNGDFAKHPRLQYVKVSWKEYIPAVLMGTATISCIIGANSIHLQRMAVMQGVYSLTRTAFKEYQTKVVKLLGEKKEQAITDEIAEDKLKDHPISSNTTIYMAAGGGTLCYDSISGRYFKNDIDRLRRIENQINKLLRTEMWVSLNEVYSEMGLDYIEMGDSIGWDVDEPLEFTFSTKLTDSSGDYGKEEPCIVVMYNTLPKPPSTF